MQRVWDSGSSSSSDRSSNILYSQSEVREISHSSDPFQLESQESFLSQEFDTEKRLPEYTSPDDVASTTPAATVQSDDAPKEQKFRWWAGKASVSRISDLSFYDRCKHQLFHSDSVSSSLRLNFFRAAEEKAKESQPNAARTCDACQRATPFSDHGLACGHRLCLICAAFCALELARPRSLLLREVTRGKNGSFYGGVVAKDILHLLDKTEDSFTISSPLQAKPETRASVWPLATPLLVNPSLTPLRTAPTLLPLWATTSRFRDEVWANARVLSPLPSTQVTIPGASIKKNASSYVVQIRCPVCKKLSSPLTSVARNILLSTLGLQQEQPMDPQHDLVRFLPTVPQTFTCWQNPRDSAMLTEDPNRDRDRCCRQAFSCFQVPLHQNAPSGLSQISSNASDSFTETSQLSPPFAPLPVGFRLPSYNGRPCLAGFPPLGSSLRSSPHPPEALDVESSYSAHLATPGTPYPLTKAPSACGRCRKHVVPLCSSFLPYSQLFSASPQDKLNNSYNCDLLRQLILQYPLLYCSACVEYQCLACAKAIHTAPATHQHLIQLLDDPEGPGIPICAPQNCLQRGNLADAELALQLYEPQIPSKQLYYPASQKSSPTRRLAVTTTLSSMHSRPQLSLHRKKANVFANSSPAFSFSE